MPPCGLRGLGGRFGELRILNLPIVLHFLDSDCELKFLLSRTELEFQAMRVFDFINREELSQSNCQPDFSLWAFDSDSCRINRFDFVLKENLSIGDADGFDSRTCTFSPSTLSVPL